MSYVQPVIDAFWRGGTKTIKNTRTDNNCLFLFGNRIAWMDLNGDVWIDTCGWKSVTTRDRLQLLYPEFILKVRKGEWQLSKDNLTWTIWDGGPINISKI